MGRERIPAAPGIGGRGDPPQGAADQRGHERQRDREGNRERQRGQKFRSRRPVGARQGRSGQDLLGDLGMGVDAGRRGIQRRPDDVRQQRGADAEEDDLAREIGEIGARFERLPCGNDAPGIVLGVIDAKLAAALGRYHGVAILDRNDAALGAEGVFAARVGGLYHISRRALRDPQRLHREARHELAIVVENERHAPDDAIVVRQPVQESDRGCIMGQTRKRREHAREPVQEKHGIVAGAREAGLDGRNDARRHFGQELPEHDRPSHQSLRESGVAGALRGVRPLAALVLGEQEVDRQRRGVGLADRINQGRHGGARPRPLPEPPDRLVVDLDDPDRSARRIDARAPTLELIEQQVLYVGAQRSRNEAPRRRRRER